MSNRNAARVDDGPWYCVPEMAYTDGDGHVIF
jgi:hypothetical protein